VRRKRLGPYRLEDLPAYPLLGAAAAADMDVVPLDLVIAAGIDLRRQQADIADFVLRTRIRASGQVNVERRVDNQTCVEIVRQCQRVPLGVGKREPAAGIAGAGDEPGADCARLGR
jgi:hypothetical protein